MLEEIAQRHKGVLIMMTNRRVLVVDDDQVVGRSINRVLAEQGYQVREALDGHEALAEMAHQDYDLVFTDIKTPGMDGLEGASWVKKAHPEIPVVVITGFGTEANENRARELGVSGFLRKPLTPEMIIENASRALREREEMKEAIPRSALALMTPEGAVAAAPAVAKQESRAKNIALFFAAPFIGLAYFLAFSFIGTYDAAHRHCADRGNAPSRVHGHWCSSPPTSSHRRQCRFPTCIGAGAAWPRAGRERGRSAGGRRRWGGISYNHATQHRSTGAG